jgi:GDPmannose 4,6-dehydratase
MSGSGRKALITGVRGQDGWYLAKTLLELGYEVIGTSHRVDEDSMRIGDRDVPVWHLDLADMARIEHLVSTQRFDEIYNLASRSSSAQLFDDVIATSEINGVAVARILESIKRHSPTTRFCQASSSEVFAGAEQTLQDESTPRIPRNAYGAAKAFADHLVTAYRSSYRLFACSAVLFSHESPRRHPHFVVRKITRGAARIATGHTESVILDNLESRRDWGYAADYMDAMRRMLQTDEPRDYVVATGQGHTVQDVCQVAFDHVGLDWRNHVEVSPRSGRVPETVARLGDARRAAADLGWTPTFGFAEMIREMVDADLALLPSRSAKTGHDALTD